MKGVHRYVTGDRCANTLCTNRMGEGAWLLVSLPTDHPPAMVLSMCSPCAEKLTPHLRDGGA